MKDRIQRIIARESLTASRFADIIGVQRSSISHILSGRNNPGLDFLSKILTHFPHISGDWLITGQGSMVKLSGAINQPKMASLFDKNIPVEEPIAENANISLPSNEIKEMPLVNRSDEISYNKTVNQPIKNSPLSSTVADNKEAMVEINSDAKVRQIVVFYADKTFDVYQPR